jgi:hypothetical protein
MLLHLEAGNCESGADADRIDDLAAGFSLSEEYTTDLPNYNPYFCPGCQRNFRWLSALYQHAETTPDCEEYLESYNCLGALERWIRDTILY